MPKTLLPYMKRLPVKRVVHVANVTEDPVRAVQGVAQQSFADVCLSVSRSCTMPALPACRHAATLRVMCHTATKRCYAALAMYKAVCTKLTVIGSAATAECCT